MNKLNLLRYVTRSQIFGGTNGTILGFQQLSKRSMGISLSPQEKNERELFVDTLPGIINTIVSRPAVANLPDMGDWIKKLLDHNLRGVNYAKSLMMLNAYEMMEKPENITEKSLHLARVVAWCVVMGQGFLTIQDDLMDGSTLRRGITCWYLMPNVGMSAVNDSLLMSGLIMETLEAYFLDKPQFVDLVRLFHEAIYYTSIGQRRDFAMAKQDKHDYSMFTIEKFISNSPYKSQYYSLRLPVMLGLTLVKDLDKRMYTGLDDITYKLGYLYQIQDDYIDCFGDINVTGKSGTDIQERKCTWLAVTALENCTAAQRAEFTKYYGSKDPQHVAKIKELYQELRIPELYQQTEKKLRNEIVEVVQAHPMEAVTKFYSKVLNRLYKRDS